MKKIPLSKNKFTLVDDESYELLMFFTWCVDGNGYAVSETFSTKRISMHRFINGTPIGMQTDHIDGDKLNNQKYNLRNATKSQNALNKGCYWKRRK